MKTGRYFLKFLVIYLIIESGQSTKIKLNTKYEAINLSSAAASIITNVWINKYATINVIKADNQGVKKYNKMNIINQLALRNFSSSKIAFRVEMAWSLKYIPRRPKQNAIIIVESFADFEEFFRMFSPVKFQINGDFLVILSHGKILQIDEIFIMLWSVQVVNVNVIYEIDNGTVFVDTFKPFDSVECGNTEPRTVNKYQDGIFEHDVNSLYTNKLHNLHGCPIRVGTSNNSEPYVFARKLANGSYHLYGRDIDLINALAQALNFRIDFVFIGEEGSLFENGTATGALEMLLKGKADIIISDYWLKVNRLNFIDFSTPYINQHIAFIIPPGAELTSLEKFIKPLGYITWVLLIIYITVAVVVIYCVRKRSVQLQDFVFGSGVKDPYMNVLIAIFGSSQTIVPRRNFARYLLMMFLIFCLVMRTLYTGSLYRFLQTKVYHKEVQSINEMVEKDFKFYTVPNIIDLVQGHSKIYERLIKSLIF